MRRGIAAARDASRQVVLTRTAIFIRACSGMKPGEQDILHDGILAAEAAP
jgi:hypothetical protein